LHDDVALRRVATSGGGLHVDLTAGRGVGARRRIAARRRVGARGRSTVTRRRVSARRGSACIKSR